MILFGIGALFAFAVFWVPIIQRWRWGLFLLFLYVPVSGYITLMMYPAKYPLLFKDLLFVIPAYLGFALWILSGRRTPLRVPASVVVLLSSLAALVVVHVFNPSTLNFLTALIGAKVWLFYLPLVFLGSALIETRDDFTRVCKILTLVSWIPVSVGILQVLLTIANGYVPTMEAFYGPVAASATQGFSRFEFGGSLFRIPSTFTFVAQYFGYLMFMMVPSYVLIRLGPTAAWRTFARVSFASIVLAALFSGQRAAFVFLPLQLFLLFAIDRQPKALFSLVITVPVLSFVGFSVLGISPWMLFDTLDFLLRLYGETVVYQGLVDAFDKTLLGLGAGMNTGPARHGFGGVEVAPFIENYYAKAVVELGVLGLVILVLLFAAVIFRGFRSIRQIEDRELRSAAAAILAFLITMIVTSLKGWYLDLDPVNVYFWLFAGILFKLPYLRSQEAMLATSPAP